VSPSKPPWWRAFDRVERKIGKPLEDAAASSRYVEVMVTGLRVQRAVGGAMARAAGGSFGAVLRVANIPTRSDVRRLSRQLTVLTTEVRQLAAAQEEAQARRNRPVAPRPSQRSDSASRRKGDDAG
jgi:hypothetical protein